ncbi:S-ribosylhomocysteine lyase [bacterium]|nr:S-ribosylhomocysteine lyase [Gemmiger sp.]MCI6519820.1 S-ribosylhomocysteine lyase [bacterium]MCI7743717.1 S-ribosylhomocysteine lyase [bacterium]MDD6717983.1 S-ribosylhomocysteine lyase [bacterium]MDY5782793.1 S-ribosylhomocysteine lyase [Gemmiger sp.]
MERIASFCVDHTTLEPGMYLSRRDGDIMTWDIRMKKPNQGDYLSPACAHTIEHLFATRARNSRYGAHVIYVGPMGCLTGFYLLTQGLTDAEALDLVRECFDWMAEYDGPIPGASAPECGNYLMMDPIAARAECRAMLPVLAAADGSHLRYRA